MVCYVCVCGGGWGVSFGFDVYLYLDFWNVWVKYCSSVWSEMIMIFYEVIFGVLYLLFVIWCMRFDDIESFICFGGLLVLWFG